MTLTEDCTCGAAIRLLGTDDDSALAERLLTEWQAAHSGPGHVSCTKAVSNLVRNGYAVPGWLSA